MPNNTDDIFDSKTSAIRALIDLFINKEESARLEEARTDEILDGKPPTGNSDASTSQSTSTGTLIPFPWSLYQPTKLIFVRFLVAIKDLVKPQMPMLGRIRKMPWKRLLRNVSRERKHVSCRLDVTYSFLVCSIAQSWSSHGRQHGCCIHFPTSRLYRDEECGKSTCCRLMFPWLHWHIDDF